MASTSHKTASPSTPSKERANDTPEITSPLSGQSTVRGAVDDENEQGSSGDEWDMEIGNLIIDLDADLEKDEMKEKGSNAKNDSRNTNNNNSIKGSSNAKSPTNSQTPKIGGPTSTGHRAEAAAATAKNMKAGSGNASSQNPGKNKSKSKKSGKSGSGTKHNGTGANTSAVGPIARIELKNNCELAKEQNTAMDPLNKAAPDSELNQSSMGAGAGYPAAPRTKNLETSQDGSSSNKPGSKSSKSGRGYKKHGKNAANEKRGDSSTTSSSVPTTGKDAREKASKAGKNGKNNSSSSVGTAHIVSTYMSSPTTPVTAAGLAVGKNKRSNSPNVVNMPKYSNHCAAASAAPNVYTSTTAATRTAGDAKAFVSQTADAAAHAPAAHHGKHRKTSSMPAPMKFPTPCSAVSSDTLSVYALTRHNMDLVAKNANAPPPTMDFVGQNPGVSGGKRDRNVINVPSSANNKKIKLEKDGKSFSSASVSGAGESAATSANSQLNSAMLTAALNSNTDYSGSRDIQSGGNRMPISTSGQTKFSALETAQNSELKTKSTASKTPAATGCVNFTSFVKASTKTTSSVGDSFAHHRAQTPVDASVNCTDAKARTRQNGASAPGMNSQLPSDTRTVGTITTYADVGVTTEPESLGPCEPGTSVHLDGIVWHETESGVLVVNVTWRNKSYVGTLLDATKHDWAPPRIPDADSDVELRAKSGRPKRQRGGNGGNGSGGDAGRKGRKSAMLNNNGDDYKNSPSSNKRRSAKMSESDAYSGNDGEICTTPSKSAKRARMSSSRATPSGKQKNTAASNVTKESTSGEGTSGSGSSACSSPVFVECPYANCKKKYNNNNALKYHEAHAHCGEDASGAEEGEKSGQDADSPVAGSPKDSDNMSTKSADEAPGSDSAGSPNDADNENVPNGPSNYQQSAAESSTAQAPFVVTQPPCVTGLTLSSAAQYVPPQYSMASQVISVAGSSSPGCHAIKSETTAYSEATKSDLAAVKVVNQEQMKEAEEMVSPYAMTDSQTSDSISLKVPAHTSKQTGAYDISRQSTSYGDSMTSTVCEPCTPMETTSAVDSESAQAVKTLLQLQDSQDQLPGLTHYNQASQRQPVSISSQSSHPPSETTIPSSGTLQPYPSQSASALPQAPERIAPRPQLVEAVMQPTPIETHQSQQAPISCHKTHTSGTHGDHPSAPLPRMSVGISSDPSGSAMNNQYVVSLGSFPSHAHGTVTTNPSQEGGVLYTSSGVKMAKGKTVPIPTDPLQTPSNPAQAGVPLVTSAGSAGKKQKKKKLKTEPGKATRHSPTDNVPKPMSFGAARPTTREAGPAPRYTVQDQSVRVKQEPAAVAPGPSQHLLQPGAGVPSNMSVHKTHHSHPQSVYNSSKVPLGQGTPGGMRTSVKSEAGPLPSQGTPQLSRTLRFAQPSIPAQQRQYQMHQKSHCEQMGNQEQFNPGAPHMLPSNKNNNNKQAPPGQPSERPVPTISHHAGGPQRGVSPSILDSSEQATGDGQDPHLQRRVLPDGRPKSHLSLPPGSSHSLPGSRSLTPINQPFASQASSKHCVPPSRESGTPKTQNTHGGSSQSGRSHSRDAGSPIQAERRGSAEESKAVTNQRVYAASTMQHLYHAFPYPDGYIQRFDPSQAKYMTDPQFQQHYENVIQQEMQKGLTKDLQQRVKKEQGPPEAFSTSRSHLSPNPSPQPKLARVKIPSPRPGVEGRSSREQSPYRSQHQAQAMHVRASHPQVAQHTDRDCRGVYNPRGSHAQVPSSRGDVRGQHGASPAPSHGSYPSTPSRLHLAAPPGARGLSPNPHATPPPMSGSRPPRPSSETERVHRRDPGLMDRPSTAMRASNPMPTRKPVQDQRPQSPEKPKTGPPHPSVYASPAIPVQTLPPGAHTPLQYYTNPYPPQIFDPRSLAAPYGFPGVHPGAYAVYPHGVFPGQWPMQDRGPPTAPPEKPSQSPHCVKPGHERSLSGSRSPYREESGRRSRGEVRGRDPGSYSSSKERRTSEGPTPVRQSITPDPKSIPVRNPGDGSGGSASPPTQRHHHTHHHIHEGFPIISPHQYTFPGPIPMASVMAGSEAAAALAQFPKRELP